MKKGTKIKKYTHMTKEDFNRIKQLIKVGVPKNVIIDMTKRSHFTVDTVKGAKNFEDYQKIVFERSRKKLGVSEPDKAVSTDTTVNLEMVEMNRQEEILTRVKNVETILNQLLSIFEDKESKANVAFWKRSK